MKQLFFCCIQFMVVVAFSQKIQLLHTQGSVSIRGLSVVNDATVWVSGNNGMVGLSLDSGKHFEWMKVKGFEQVDFRDIEAFSTTEAVIMGIAEPAYILKTVDAGKTWKVVYKNETKGMFLDAMEWWNPQSGIVIGDPINGSMFVARTFDEGATWQTPPTQNLPKLVEGEACFASSGTNVRSFGTKEAVFITGGQQSKFYRKNKIIALPMLQGEESTGANSIAIHAKRKNIIIVGGDFNKKDSVAGNCALSKNGGKSFYKPNTSPTGYRSCVEYIGKQKAITCGLNGVDISNDHGNNWTNIATSGFHVVRKAKEGSAVYLAGSGGRIAKLIE
jgi:photosystem II stability/assembly factor-like uncharacterized protein